MALLFGSSCAAFWHTPPPPPPPLPKSWTWQLPWTPQVPSPPPQPQPQITVTSFFTAIFVNTADTVSVVVATTGILALLLGQRIATRVKSNCATFANGIIRGVGGGRRNFAAEFFTIIFIVPAVMLVVAPFLFLGSLIEEASLPLLVLCAAQMYAAYYFDDAYWMSVRVIGLAIVPGVLTVMFWPQLTEHLLRPRTAT